MPYAILRFEKHKGGPAKSLEAHHERKKDSYNSNPDIDSARSGDNYHFIKPTHAYYFEIQKRIEQAGCRTRRDSIKFVDTIVTASPELFANMTDREKKLFFQHALDFLSNRVGLGNIFSAVVHMDERTPHMHLCFVPLTADNRLSAKELLGNKAKLVQWQDDFYAHMARAYPQLQRGEPARETQRRHIPVRLFKQAERLDRQLDEVTALLSDMNVFNAAKKRDKALQMLTAWCNSASSFQQQLHDISSTNRQLGQTLDQLKQDSEHKEGALEELHGKYSKLLEQHYRIRKFIDFIPEDLFEELKRGYDAVKAIHDLQRGYEDEQE